MCIYQDQEVDGKKNVRDGVAQIVKQKLVQYMYMCAIVFLFHSADRYFSARPKYVPRNGWLVGYGYMTYHKRRRERETLLVGTA
jgi:hypothetical protein